jgi:carboxypeptidase D
VTPEHNGNLFFWLFQNKHIANKQRTVIWLNGGPGCSSEDGALMEIGPYRLKDDHTLEYNDGSWHEFANLLFVDNPVGTGFSYVDTDSFVTELDQMADQFVQFLEKWFDLFPEYAHDDLYIAGESYAGQHIPYIAKHILDRNHGEQQPNKIWNLKGLVIGNGWISPPEQYEAYLQFAYDKGIVTKNSDTAKILEQQHAICKADLASKSGKVDYGSCEQILNLLLQHTQTDGPNGKECYNMYDVRLKDTFPSCGMNWPSDLTKVTPYLRRTDVTQALHINPGKSTGWTECTGAVSSSFRASNSKPAIEFLPEIVSQIPVLLFSGAEDLICNHFGTEALISNMEWNGAKGFETSPGTWAPRRHWMFEGEAAGFWQEARDLTYVLFYNSSHMVPYDYARRTRDMLDRFMEVDISSVGGTPADSRLDGEKGPETTVGGAAGNTTAAQEAEQAKLNAAKWAAYQKSGEIVLVIVIIAASAWGYFVWRERRRRHLGYMGVAGGESNGRARRPGGRGGQRGTALDNFRNKRSGRDVEAADFDEGELDDLHVRTPTERAEPRYSIGEGSDDEPGKDGKPTRNGNGQESEVNFAQSAREVEIE